MRNKGIWKILAILMVLAMVVAMPSAAAVSESDGDSSSTTIYVPDSYPTIQAAVDAASPGDTIIVRDGEYRENIDVDKRLTIKSENGSVNCIVEAEGRYDHIFDVTAEYVNISGFTVKGGYYYGIYLYLADHCSISNNNCYRNDAGIYIEYSKNNSITNNICSNNDYSGIYLKYSINNRITNNICSNNRGKGIYLRYSKNNSISNNNFSNTDDGIYLGDSENNSISNNICSNNRYGIYLRYSKNNKLTGNVMLENGIVIHGYRLSDYTNEIDESNTVNGKPVYYWKDIEKGRVPNGAGQVILVNCTNVVVENQNLNNAHIGIHLAFSSSITIKNNNCSNNRYGIYLRDSENNSISNNICSNNCRGIYLDYYSENNSIWNNNCSNTEDYGIYIRYSENNKLTGNVMLENGIVISGETPSDYSNEIDESNTVNGKPVYYWKNIQGGKIPDGAGQVILVNCTNVVVENQNLNNASIGLQLAYSSSITIKNNNCSNNRYGIYLRDSENNSISNNICSNNGDGIYLGDSENNSISNNICSNNRYGFGIFLLYSKNNSITNNICSNNRWNGIILGDSKNNRITNNICSNNGCGIYLRDSKNNCITNNTCSNNEGGDICLAYSKNNKLTGNVMLENGIVIVKFSSYNSLSDYTHEIDESNTVNGKPVYYWKDKEGGKIPDGAGQVILVNCMNVIVENQNLNNASTGIVLAYSSSITIKNNICSNNRWNGIDLEYSKNNRIYLNDFVNNTDNVHSYYSNTWNSPETITYTYNGSTYAKYLGNYWDDYTGNDTNNDGIGDTPYYMHPGIDNYPLMHPWENYFVKENGTMNKNETHQFAFSSYYQPINSSVNLSVPPYPLPLNLSNVTNIENITAKLKLSERGKELLKNNGFVIIDYGRRDDIVAPYENLKWRDIPIFVTTDTLLHLYHIQFNEILKGVEEREFFDELVDMSSAMLEQSIQDYENFTDPEMKEAARRNVAYFAVALKLLQTPTEGYDEERLKREIEEWNTKYPWDKKTFKPIRKVEFEIPDYVKDDVDKEIENIEQHDGPHPSVIFNYSEDYSQYVPRGHYTRSEKLKRYFNAMMWYGRMAFFLKGGDDALISEQDAKISTIQAALISSELPDVTLNNKTAQEIWDRIYSVTAFFVGTADDLTPYEYRDAMNNVFGAEYNVSKLSTEDNLLELKVELARLRSPKIYGGSGVCVVYPPITKEKLYKCLNETKGMRFMGQRFIPDSYMFQQLVSPAVGVYVGNNTPFTMCRTPGGPARCFPRGLDIMAVLGSERAEDILIEDGDTEYAGINTSYDKQLKELKLQFAGFDVTEWNRNLYWSWLYTLKPLLKQFEDGYPTFMQTRAWQNKELQTSLASWTELRHDTILYAKQSYTPVVGAPPQPPQQPKPKGYVEPVPEFYARLLALTEMTENGLVDLDVLNETEKARLKRLERILERLINISKAELENKELTEGDYEFIRNFGERLDYVVAGVDVEGKETTIVADVHTDCNTGKVLEEGVGYVNLILVAYNVPDGRIIIGAGPVFSYYEFKHPMDDRLKDKEWKEMLRSNPPERPGWVRGIEADW